MKNARPEKKRIDRIAMRTQKTLLPLVAVGGSLAGLPANALELGDLTVQSRLGQPLRASIAFALAPNEQLADSCVTLGAGASTSGLPGVGRAAISIADGVILLTGKTPVREPMVAAQLVVDCAYTANLSREYMLFIDPAIPAFDEQAVAQTTSVASARQSSTVTPARQAAAITTRRAPVRKINRDPIGKSTRYRVQPGDSLSRIAERIENRSIRLWPAVDAIFDANPDAFIDNDPNKLKAGSWLAIPSFDGSEPVVSDAASSSGAAAVDLTTSSSGVAQFEAPEVEQTTASDAPPVETTEAGSAIIAETVSDESTDLSPGDIVPDTDNPFVDGVATANDNIIIPDTELDGPTITSVSPNVPTAVINTSSQESSSSLLMWLAGSGLVMIIGLLLFGRRYRERISTPPMPPLEDQPARRATDGVTGELPAIPPIVGELDDDTPTEENLALDADLVVGTGLEQGTDLEVAQDFGFAAPTELDIELPFEPDAEIAANSRDDSILDSEVLPDDEDYDLSVILDATKMPQPGDTTERDLQAIEISPEDDTAETDTYMIDTMNTQVDLEILEQDYEDELSATQMLNAELARAATANPDSADGDVEDQETEALPLATVTELDITVQMPSRDENTGDEDDTGVYEGATVEMPAAENDDDTQEMDVEGGTVDTKAI
ncbi:MAG: hypothetical protein GY783_18065 [Gammaproteobacteria bacterium]|nr:hypothetical protein [Gammaproteobacteria bacterium]